MRPTLSILNSFFALTSSVQKPLIACGDVGYDQQILPVEVCFHHDRDLSTNHDSLNGEAEMDRKGSNRTNPNQVPGQPSNTDMARDKSSDPETIEERLARIKAEIEAGVYETPEKLEIAIDRMFGAISE
ncbi:hypothetical protein OAF42_03050 [Planctomicrobium sp.]|jgi:hypothetical protein|nr:hypothetical protein [Planctomicrobium sp.]MBT5019782.1 hypothetical protein [Planctomicrobium sp.]MDB4733402.1 hypothetical protein [Planctomicrobium sp.]